MNKTVASVIITLLLLKQCYIGKIKLHKEIEPIRFPVRSAFYHVLRSRVNRCYNMVQFVGLYFSIAGLVRKIETTLILAGHCNLR